MFAQIYNAKNNNIKHNIKRSINIIISQYMTSKMYNFINYII